MQKPRSLNSAGVVVEIPWDSGGEFAMFVLGKDERKRIENITKDVPVRLRQLNGKTPHWRYQKRRFLRVFLRMSAMGLLWRFLNLTVVIRSIGKTFKVVQ